MATKKIQKRRAAAQPKRTHRKEPPAPDPTPAFLNIPALRKLSVVAQDPSVKGLDGRILRAEVLVPRERIAPGPKGYRVDVIDFDSSTQSLLPPFELDPGHDPFGSASDREILENPAFHAMNVYAIVMRILSRFEFALGRRVAWSFGGHQLKVAPHAFLDANAFYSADDEALFFGYFPSAEGSGHVFTCLSHDVIAHETTHALLDGLRERYRDPSSPDQAAFHEGFADVVALLSVFAQKELIETQLGGVSRAPRAQGRPLIKRDQLSAEALRNGPVLGLAEQMGEEIKGARGAVLRRSTELPRSSKLLEKAEFQESHRRGEVFVAAMMDFFIEVWAARLSSLGDIRPGLVDRKRVVEEGANIADHLLTISIRALDYTPPVDIQFGDYLSALLTADRELFHDDDRYRFRDHVRRSFATFGIAPASDVDDEGTWDRESARLSYDCNHFEPLQRDPDEVFRFIWENRSALELHEDAYCRVVSVRPCMRQGPDGFFLRETVAEYVETLQLRASELGSVALQSRRKGAKPRPLRAPRGMKATQEVTLHGGGALIFDEFGRLKYHIKNRIDSPRQQQRLQHLFESGYFDKNGQRRSSFAEMHLRRSTPAVADRRLERW